MFKRLRERLHAARKRLWRLVKKRHDLPRGSEAREDAAKCVREARAAKQRLVKELRKAKKPDFNGCPQNVTQEVRAVIVLANHAGLYVTATTNGGHAPTSYHYSGRAVDVAAPMNAQGIARMVKFQRAMANNPGRFVELFGPDNGACVKNGVRITLGEGTALENQHDNHVHLAL